MGCNDGITKIITSTCATTGSGGLEVKAWIINREDVTITYDPTIPLKITAITYASTKRSWPITGIKKLLNAGSDIVVADDRPDKYTHYFNFQQFEFASEDVYNVDNMKDVIMIVESKDKADDGDGVFIAYGVKKGLWKSTDTQRANDINGARNIELTSIGGQEEPFSRYVYLATDYATTLAALVASETPAV